MRVARSLWANGRHRLRTAAFEAPDGVEHLDLQRHGAAERFAERRARQRRRVEEHRIDLAHGATDPIEPESNAVEAPHSRDPAEGAGERPATMLPAAEERRPNIEVILRGLRR